MEPKTPVILVVLVESSRLRWFVAGLGLEGELLPLIRSEEGNLAPYQGVPIDEQISFLRHRLCGVLQRGCGRLWEQKKKACQFAFVFEGLLEDDRPEGETSITQLAGQHFAEWMNNPPSVTFAGQADCEAGSPYPTDKLAGEIEPAYEAVLSQHLPKLLELQRDETEWELVVKPQK